MNTADIDVAAEPALVYLGLGSNMGDRMANLEAAIERLHEHAVIRAIASVYETAPVGYEEQPMFLNTALSATTLLSPPELLRFAKRIEVDLGRQPGFHNAPRPIDVDILLYGDLVVSSPELTIPHPGIAERAFVLAPLSEIAFEVVHPVSARRIGDLLDDVGMEGVRPVGRLEAS